MTYALLILLGLSLGSFVNALVWRLRQAEGRRQKAEGRGLSILNGRSMCPNCKHTLAARDLIPIISWLSLKGKCRYCQKPIHWQYPLVELITAGLFIFSYAFWPYGLGAGGSALLGIWLVMAVILVALAVYDIRWMLLPNTLVYPLILVALVFALIRLLVIADNGIGSLAIGVLSVGGFFYALFQISGGKWIGGGDVKLGFGLGLILGSGSLGLLMIFIASWLGTMAALPLYLRKRQFVKQRIPFGPFLILATALTFFYGNALLEWYGQQFLYL